MQNKNQSAVSSPKILEFLAPDPTWGEAVLPNIVHLDTPYVYHDATTANIHDCQH